MVNGEWWSFWRGSRLRLSKPYTQRLSPFTIYYLLPSELSHLRVERVAQAVAEEVEREERQRHRHAGEDELPGEDRDVLDAFLREAPPGRVRRLHAEPEEREERLLQHHGGDRQRRVDDDRPQGV